MSQKFLLLISFAAAFVIFLNPSLAFSCYDNDGGDSIYNFGRVIDQNGKEYVDSCVGNSTLRENFCIGDTPSSYEANCSYGCLNGACESHIENLLEQIIDLIKKFFSYLGIELPVTNSATTTTTLFNFSRNSPGGACHISITPALALVNIPQGVYTTPLAENVGGGYAKKEFQTLADPTVEDAYKVCNATTYDSLVKSYCSKNTQPFYYAVTTWNKDGRLLWYGGCFDDNGNPVRGTNCPYSFHTKNCPQSLQNLSTTTISSNISTMINATTTTTAGNAINLNITTTTTINPTTTTMNATTTSSTTTTSPTTTTTGAPETGAPDLTAKSAGNFQGSGFSTYLNFSVTNSGTVDAGAFDVNVTVSNSSAQYINQNINPSGVWYIGKTRINGLAAGATTYISFNVTNATYYNNYDYLPNDFNPEAGIKFRGAKNQYYVNITADNANEIFESNENNNMNSTYVLWNITNSCTTSPYSCASILSGRPLQFIGSSSSPTG